MNEKVRVPRTHLKKALKIKALDSYRKYFDPRHPDYEMPCEYFVVERADVRDEYLFEEEGEH
jgi:hypothetical protein